MINTEDKQVLIDLFQHKVGSHDGKKVGLVIQGGGIRGAFPAGVLAYMASIGLNNSFDVIYTASSGCNSALWFLDGRYQQSLSSYWEDIPGFKFFRPWRYPKVMNLEMIERLNITRGLDFKKIKDSETLVKFFVTNLNTGRVEYYTNHQEVDLNSVITASSAFPALYPPVVIKGETYIDGNIATILPVEEAILDRCTDIVVITTVPREYRQKKLPIYYQVLHNFMGRKYCEEIRRIRRDRMTIYNRSLEIAFGIEVPNPDVRMYTFVPEYKIKNLERNAKKIKNYADLGWNTAKQTFEDILIIK